MVNIEDFSKRLKIVMDYYELSASLMADKIAVQRSSISHIISGRNKPSLEFVLKVLKAFPEIELYWLLNGTGAFPKTAPPTPSTPQENLGNPTQISNSETIERIVVFYKNGTFKNYTT